MSFEEGTFSGYNGVKLHYLQNIAYNDSIPPVLIVPALPESAIDYKDIIYLLENKSIALTHRGREQSEAPESGYSLKDHGEDISCAINHFNLENVIIIAYSRGVGYLLQILPNIHQKLKGLILIDYPANFKALKTTWPTKFLNQSWRAMPIKERFPKPFVLTKIQQETNEMEYWDKLHLLKNIPVLLMVGARSYTDPFLIRSKVTDEDISRYQEHLPDIKIVEFEKSGHDLRLWEYDKFISTIRDFLKIFNPPKEIESNFGNKNLTEETLNDRNFFSKIKNLVSRSPGIQKDKIIKLNK